MKDLDFIKKPEYKWWHIVYNGIHIGYALDKDIEAWDELLDSDFAMLEDYQDDK